MKEYQPLKTLDPLGFGVLMKMEENDTKGISPKDFESP